MRTAALLLATTGLAGTKAQMNIVPTPADCFVGPGFCLNVAAGCGLDNSDCAAGTMSPKSKFKLDGKKVLKAKIKGVTDNMVTLSVCPVDTGAPPICDDPTSLYLKVVLTDGKGSLNLDLAPVAFGAPAGTPIALLGVTLWAAPGVGDCPGTNSAADITTRLNDGTCESNGIVRHRRRPGRMTRSGPSRWRVPISGSPPQGHYACCSHHRPSAWSDASIAARIRGPTQRRATSAPTTGIGTRTTRSAVSRQPPGRASSVYVSSKR